MIPDTEIHFPEQLRPGDIFLGPIGGLTGLGVGLGQLMLGEGFRVGRLSIRHAGIVVKAGVWPGPPAIAQAMPTGAEIVPLNWDKHWTERCAFVRLPEDYSGQAEDAAAIARKMVEVGVGYSFLSYPSLAAYRLGFRQERLLRYINRRREPIDLPLKSAGVMYPSLPGRPGSVRVALPVEAICSVFVDQAWSLAGKCVMDGVRPQAVTPGALAETLMSYRDATWVRPMGRSAKSYTI